MQPTRLEGVRSAPKPASVVVIVIQCVALASLFAGASLVLANAIVSWADIG